MRDEQEHIYPLFLESVAGSQRLYTGLHPQTHRFGNPPEGLMAVFSLLVQGLVTITALFVQRPFCTCSALSAVCMARSTGFFQDGPRALR